MKKKLLSFVFPLLLLGALNQMQAQRIIIEDPETNVVGFSGPTSVLVNNQYAYTASILGATIYTGSWSVTGGTIISQSSTTATIRWTSTGTQRIDYAAIRSSVGYVEGFYLVNVAAASAPATPPNPIIVSQNCSSASLQKSGSPPSGVTWYWQETNSAGTSTANTATSNYAATTSGYHYIRARNTSGVWSSGSGRVYVALGTVGGSTWYADADGDGLGDPAVSLVQCTQPVGYVSNANDQCPTQHGGGNPTGCVATQSLSNQNYVYTLVAQEATTNIENLLATNRDQVLENVTYFDGLGRPMQSIAIRQGGQGKDVVTHFTYDAFGRQVKEYLPYAATSANGLFKTDALVATNSFYNTSTYGYTLNPYSEKGFEASPLSRQVEQGAPGNDWKITGTMVSGKDYSNGHTIKFEQATNGAYQIKKYTVSLSFANNTYTPTLTGGDANFYAAGALYKSVTKDENWTTTDGVNKTTEEYKDKSGRVVLKRAYNNSTAHDTYYVYDMYGNLTYVLPPKMDAQNASLATLRSRLNDLGYQYVYDQYNRSVEKRIPGKGWEYIVYDKLDRPILTQDAVQAAKSPKEWLFTKYDVYGRVAYTGLYKTNLSRVSVQGQLNSHATVYEGAGANFYGYSNNAYPQGISSTDIYTVHYYDNYTFDRAGTGTQVYSYGMPSTTNVKGLPTGTKVRVLGTSSWITTVNYYDEKGREIYIYSNNTYLGSTDIVQSRLDFTGKVTESLTLHTKNDDDLPITLQIRDVFSYDHSGRLTQQTQNLNNSRDTQVIVANSYDALGQLTSKGVGGKTTQGRLQTVDYSYNVRGWLTGINNVNSLGSDLFAFALRYNDASDPTKRLYNGNISQTQWRTANVDSSLKNYTYSYDALNRITAAVDNTAKYNLDFVAYDKNGNITTLKRKGHTNATADIFGMMDDLSFIYDSGNKLLKVSDSGNSIFGFKDGANLSTEYTYDANGNMKTDANKGISNSISYNHLNLPTQITLGPGQTISYTYDAMGTKLRKSAQGTITDYAGNFVYTKVGTAAKKLQFFNHAEGYVQNNNGVFSYVYQYKDHLGNVRLSYADTNNNGVVNQSEIIEENNYYPFGLQHKGYNNNVSPNGNTKAQWFKYNGKELEASYGVNLYEMDVRMYDPAIARWNGIDPVVHFSQGTSVAFDNNPIFWADPSGADSRSMGMGSTTYDCSTGNCNFGIDGFGAFSANGAVNNDPKEGETKPEIQDRGRSGFVNTGNTLYWHTGGLNGSKKGWYTESEYLNIITPAALARVRIDFGSIEWLNNVDAVDGYNEFISNFEKVVYKRYLIEKKLNKMGYIKEMNFSSPFFVVGGISKLFTGSKVASVSSGGTKLLGPAPANLTQNGLDHIIARHWFSSGAKGAGKFAQGTTGASLKEMINRASRNGTFRPNTLGRPGTIAEYNFGRVIGTTSSGAPASSLRVVIGTNGNVITAFPF